MTVQNRIDVLSSLYEELDKRLVSSPWDGSVSEAHGLLTGLACLGITENRLADKLYLFQQLGDEESTLLEAMFGLIVQDLESDSPTFNPLLPNDEETLGKRIEELANWCSGFTLGYCHDDNQSPTRRKAAVSEVLHDILEISAMQGTGNVTHTEQESHEQERQLVEIEEYLRISIQLIYEESVTRATHRPDDCAAETYH